MIYKERIKKLRERIGLTQSEIASILGISKARYCFYETETDLIPIKHLISVCNYFDTSVDYIFSFSDNIKYNNSSNAIDKKKIGLRIKEIRKDNNLTQLKLASLLNIASGTIAEYERGTNIIATPFLYTICKKYGVSADYLLGKIDSPKYFNK